MLFGKRKFFSHDSFCGGFPESFRYHRVELVRESSHALQLWAQFSGLFWTIYSNISSSVMNNGRASHFFSLMRGVRQDCPLSGLLFVKYWKENKPIILEDNTHKQNEIIWKNKSILINKQMICLKQWHRAGIMY